jgi:hypothetical protein
LLAAKVDKGVVLRTVVSFCKLLFDNAMVGAGYVWADYKKQLKKGEQWNVEVY